MNNRLMIFCVLILTSFSLLPVAFAEQQRSPEELETLLIKYPMADLNKDGALTNEELNTAMQRLRQWQKKNAKPDIAPPVTHEDVKYGPFNRNVLDLWLPESDQPTPLVVFIHGGGFNGGNKREIRKSNNVRKVLDEGVAFAAINYRFRPTPNLESPDPQRTGIHNILRDAARSIQFLRLNAEKYNLDAGKIACYGGSAGGGTSAWLAFHDDLANPQDEDPVLRQSSRISAAASLAGQYSYDLEQWDEDFSDIGGDFAKTHGGEQSEMYVFYGMTQSQYRESQIAKDVHTHDLITPDDAPIFAIAWDPNQKVRNANTYYHHPRHALLIEERCKEKGVECMCLVPKVRDKDKEALEANPDAMMDFLFQHLDGE